MVLSRALAASRRARLIRSRIHKRHAREDDHGRQPRRQRGSAGIHAGPAGALPALSHRRDRRRLHHGRCPSGRLCRWRLPGRGDRLALAGQGQGSGRALGYRDGARDTEGADRGQPGRDSRHRLPARPAADADPPCPEAAAHQGDPGAEAPRHGFRHGQGSGRRGEGRRQGPVGQSEHALRPVDAGAQAIARSRRARRAGAGDDRDARHPALAAFFWRATAG